MLSIRWTTRVAQPVVSVLPLSKPLKAHIRLFKGEGEKNKKKIIIRKNQKETRSLFCISITYTDTRSCVYRRICHELIFRNFHASHLVAMGVQENPTESAFKTSPEIFSKSIRELFVNWKVFLFSSNSWKFIVKKIYRDVSFSQNWISWIAHNAKRNKWWVKRVNAGVRGDRRQPLLQNSKSIDGHCDDFHLVFVIRRESAAFARDNRDIQLEKAGWRVIPM